MSFLKKRADFIALQAGARAQAPGFLLVGRDRGDGDCEIRVGFTVTKKIGGAVIRNRIRRRLREAARAVAPEEGGAAGWDYNLIARPAAATRAFADLLDDLRRALLSLARRPR